MRTVIADDEAPARRLIRQYLADFPEVEIVAEAANGIEAEALIREHRPDLLFLDVQMPGRTGFEVIDALHLAPPEAMPRIVFSTAYDQYAVQAFEVAAVDYLLKPYDRARFADAIRRVLASGETTSALGELAALLDARQRPTYSERLLVRDGARVIPVETAEILWAEASGDTTTLHATGGRAHLVGQRLGAMAERLDPQRFVRVHRSAVVALAALRGLEPDGSGGFRATLVDGTALRVSRTYAPALRDRLV